MYGQIAPLKKINICSKIIWDERTGDQKYPGIFENDKNKKRRMFGMKSRTVWQGDCTLLRVNCKESSFVSDVGFRNQTDFTA